MLSSLYDDLNNGSPPTAAVTTRYTKYLNDAIRSIVAEPGMVRLLDSDTPFPFTTVAQRARYTLPEIVSEIRHLRETTNDRTLAVMDLGRYRRMDPDPTSTTGTSSYYVPIGRVGVHTQPADSSTLFVKSSRAGDTGTAYATGYNTLGKVIRGKVTMTGVTAVAIVEESTGNALAFREVTDFFVTPEAVGEITLHEDSGLGTELSQIPEGSTKARYLGLYLWPTPSAVLTYSVDFRRLMVNLSVTTDEPPGPIECHPYYTAYARMREYEKTNDDRYQTAQAEWQQWRSRLKFAVLENPEEIPVAREGGGLTGHSRLGGWFPADHYHRS